MLINGGSIWGCTMGVGSVYWIQERRGTHQRLSPSPSLMNYSPATVYPNVDAAAYVWPPQDSVDEDTDSWLKRMMMDYCNKTLDCLNDETLSASYKVGYSKAYIKGLKRLIQLQG